MDTTSLHIDCVYSIKLLKGGRHYKSRYRSDGRLKLPPPSPCFRSRMCRDKNNGEVKAIIIYYNVHDMRNMA